VVNSSVDMRVAEIGPTFSRSRGGAERENEEKSDSGRKIDFLRHVFPLLLHETSSFRPTQLDKLNEVLRRARVLCRVQVRNKALHVIARLDNRGTFQLMR